MSHLAKPFPSEYESVIELFGDPSDCVELFSWPDWDELTQLWGSPDLRLYDTYVAGYADRVFSGQVDDIRIDELRPDSRLGAYFEICKREAPTKDVENQIRICQQYFDQLNDILAVVRASIVQGDPPT